MAFVVDASVAMSWSFADETTPFTQDVLDALRRSYAEVLARWLLEVKNVLLINERRSRVTAQGSKDFPCSPQPTIIPSMAVIHISEADAARDLPALLAQVRAGAEVVIESNTNPIAVLHAPPPARRSITESIDIADAYSRELGYEPIMDAEFAADMQEIVRNRKPRDTSAWDRFSIPPS